MRNDWCCTPLVLLVLGCGTAPTSQVSAGAESPPAENRPTTRGAEQTELPNLWTRQRGEDWPGFLGPTSDSKSSEQGLIVPWPEEGPRIVWQRPLGEGYGIGSISRGRLFQFDRYGNENRLLCLHAETGRTLWQFAYPADYVDSFGYNGGPRSSPVVDGNRVYLFGAEGMLHCLRASDGKPLWKVDTAEQFGVVQNFFGVGSTPVVEGDLLIVMVGGSPPDDRRLDALQLDRVTGNGTGIVALDKFTGQVRYAITDELASYASPKLATIAGRRWCFVFARGGLVGFEPARGEVDFHFPWRARLLESVNASTPVVVGNQVFISETYGPGSALLEVGPGQCEVVWQDDPKKRAKAMKAHWNTPIYHEGYLYGCSGRNPPDAELRCIRWQTGEVMWSVPNRTRTSLLYVDGHFVCLGEFGTLQLLKANPERFELVSEVALEQASEKENPLFGPQPLLKTPCWAAPIVSHGLLYVRGRDRLVCLEVIPE